MSTKSTSEAHRRYRQRRKERRAAEPDTSLTCWEAGQRGGLVPKPGEKNGNHKLTQADVNAIRARKARLIQELAEVYGVSREHIQAVWRGDYWRHSDAKDALGDRAVAGGGDPGGGGAGAEP